MRESYPAVSKHHAEEWWDGTDRDRYGTVFVHSLPGADPTIGPGVTGECLAGG